MDKPPYYEVIIPPDERIRFKEWVARSGLANVTSESQSTKLKMLRYEMLLSDADIIMLKLAFNDGVILNKY